MYIKLAFEVLSKLPAYICYLIIFVWYLWRVIKETAMILKYGYKEAVSLAEPNSI